MANLKMFDLTGKHAIVTGGGRGLGRGMAEGLAEAGASVVIVGSSHKTVAAGTELRARGLDVQVVQGNLMEAEAVPEIFNQSLTLLDDKIDILINNAGIQRRHPCEEFPLSDWQDVMRMNLDVVFRLCQLAGTRMLAQGYGKIINMASMLSFFGGFTVPAYAASKGGIAQLTKALANEWSGRGVHVNAIAPGYMDTDMNTNLMKDEKRQQEILARIPMGRWGTPEDMKGLAIFLASPASDYINGAVIPIDGAYLAK